MSLPDWSPGATRSLLLVAAVACVVSVVLTSIVLADTGTGENRIEHTSQPQQVTEVLVQTDAVSASNLTIQPGETERIATEIAAELDVSEERIVVRPGVGNGTVEVREAVVLSEFGDALEAVGFGAEAEHRIGPTDETLVTTGNRLRERFDRIRMAPTLVETTQFEFGMYGLWILAENAHESWVQPVTNTQGEFQLLVETEGGEREAILNRSHIETVGTRGFADGEPVVPVTLTDSGANALQEAIREHNVGAGRDCDSENGTCLVVRIDDRDGPTFGVPDGFEANDSREMLIPTSDATESIWVETTLAVDPLPVPVVAETRVGGEIVGHPPDEGSVISPGNVSVEPPPVNDDPDDDRQSGDAEETAEGDTYEPPRLPEEPADIASDEQGDGFTAVVAVAAVFLATLIGRRYR